MSNLARMQKFPCATRGRDAISAGFKAKSPVGTEGKVSFEHCYFWECVVFTSAFWV